jgi:CRP-like cAMP-binding protein
MSIAALLSTTPGFLSIEPEELERIAQVGRLQVFHAGAYIMRAGERGDSMHVIVQGRVRIPVLDSSGILRSEVHLGPREIVGEMALLTGEPRRADVVAEVDTTTFSLAREALQALLSDQPELACFLTEIVGRRIETSGVLERVGKYRLLSKIGEGTTGKVYEGVHEDLERVVAIKMLSHSLVYSPRFLDRFRSEARTIARLSHPNIVQVFDTEAAYATFFMVMERLSGTDLARVLRVRGVLSPVEACKVLRQVASALAYAHGRGFAHRDIKPANLGIDDDWNAKLMDFGLSRPIPNDADGRRSKTVEGTPQYLAPEAARGLAADGRADIYSLGVMAFEMVAGHLPFQAETASELMRAHVLTPPPDLRALRPDLPEGLLRFVEGALRKRPEERLCDWGQIQRMLDLEGQADSLSSDDVREEIVHIRFRPEASARVHAAVAELARALGEGDGVEVSSARLEKRRRP